VPNETKTAITDGTAIGSFLAAKLKVVLHFDFLWLRQVHALAAVGIRSAYAR
jgi:hypothetical protein